ncbi:hypothetical protein BJAS_P4407 [Bathymodiolus japonicus methanotrophic gill symbiont]|uniref:hypothetical protein n=1 Tax=Bathymodiolus japonicus methanotrophic gill symbiont TaxID=113269 RepID=UPI001B69BE12|nr:hypothetical protein [Bathymodiolus japonicus methanotrophic gill symbiont]GFO73293.1 hypothetical protein BJAS_P4018 [Bathymodiolus japonicus methanotrophic gill symbiont]GFO73555.1 hypothetical protein BJAS_P4407 [Bathymodiolus japonicus methanotrophic gill symbiont]
MAVKKASALAGKPLETQEELTKVVTAKSFTAKGGLSQEELLKKEQRRKEREAKAQQLIDEKNPRANKTALSMTIRWNQFESEQLDKLQDTLGLTRVGVIRLAVNQLIKKEFS